MARELQIWHWAVVCRTLASKPSQNRHCLAFASMLLTPWCAEWRDLSTSAQSLHNVRILFSFSTPNSLHMGQNHWQEVLAWFEKATHIYSARIWHSKSAAATATILCDNHQSGVMHMWMWMPLWLHWRMIWLHQLWLSCRTSTYASVV